MTRRPECDRRLMLSFVGTELPDGVRKTLGERDVSGVTLFRSNNYRDPEQLRSLVAGVQRARSGSAPLLIAVDQEGGQLHAFGEPATMWPGNMALGAVDDVALTRRVGEAIGSELRAVGINVNYAPVADLATNPRNPATGARSFGEEPKLVARHVAAMVEGLQSVGVAATMKHFPGKGDSAVDSHHALPVIMHERDHLDQNEFLPFRSAIDAGVKLAMTGHFALPALTGSAELPCTLAVEANTRLLRREMGFEGAMITDALDMRALRQGAFQIVDIIAAINSGVDLLLLTADPEQEERATLGIELAVSRRLTDPARLAEADERVITLRRWVGTFADPSLDVVGSADHTDLAAEVARRSITVVRNDAGLLPIDPSSVARVLVVEMEPTNLTPADTTNFDRPHLREGIAGRFPTVLDPIVVPLDPTRQDIEGARHAANGADLVIIGTSAAALFPHQAELVRSIAESHDRVVVVAQRTPWDLESFDALSTYLCSWSTSRTSAQAAAAALVGAAPVTGRTPVTIGAVPEGSGIEIGR